MTCHHCDSNRVASVSAKCSDMCDVSIGDEEHDGYVPEGLGIGGGDYISFSYCLDCGTIQGSFPRPPTKMEQKAKRCAEWMRQKQIEEQRIRDGLTPEKMAFIEGFKEFLDEIGFTDPMAVLARLTEDTHLLTHTLHYLRTHGRVEEADWVMRLIENLDGYPEIVEGLRALKTRKFVEHDIDDVDYEDEEDDED